MKTIRNRQKKVVTPKRKYQKGKVTSQLNRNNSKAKMQKKQMIPWQQ